MTIKSHLEDAQESIRQALILALEEKKEYQVTKLFSLYNHVKDSIPVESSINFSTDLKGPFAAQPITSNYFFGGLGEDVISFGGDTVLTGSSNTDTISLG